MSENRCRYCHTEINAKAKKCKYCGSWQGLRRFLTSANLILTISVSSIATFFAIGLPIIDLLDEKEPNLDATILYSDYDELKIVLSNLGEAPAGITEVFVSISEDSEQPMRFPIATELWGKLIKKESYEQITLKRDLKTGLPIMVNENHKIFKQEHVSKCALFIRYVDFNSDIGKEQSNAFNCYNFSPLPEGLKRTDFY